jgi:2-oxoglutarate ferredoxin oxidoreductase subunit alpha
LAPSGAQEAYDLSQTAFRLADKYRIAVMILGDGVLGQMMEPVNLSVRKADLPVRPWALTGCRGRKPNIVKSFFMREGDLEKSNLILQKNYALIKEKEQRYESLFLNDADLVLVAYGRLRVSPGERSTV